MLIMALRARRHQCRRDAVEFRTEQGTQIIDLPRRIVLGQQFQHNLDVAFWSVGMDAWRRSERGFNCRLPLQL